jgi:demethylmenaquinone methyltransferase/2-methoxy-6-polyprenyl-1,4-benzoquinol methylase
MGQPPLPAKTHYWRRDEDRQQVVNDLFARSANYYDRACSIMSFGSGQRYRRDALERSGLRAGMRVLDVGTGTGLLAREIARITGSPASVVGLDPSHAMMMAGRALTGVPLVQGLGEALPFASGHFDFLTMGYALRHVADLDQTFDEYRRVLKPGGRILLLEITRPASAFGNAAARMYFGGAVPLMTRLWTGSQSATDLMRFYWHTIAECVPPDVVLASLQRVGLAAPARHVVYGIFSEYSAVRPA